jgi:hypothetical protein
MTPSADNFASRGPTGFRSDAADALGFGDESAAVAGVAAGGGGDRVTRPTFMVAQRAKTPQRRQRLGDGVRRQQAGGLHLAAEAAQRFFVEDRDGLRVIPS